MDKRHKSAAGRGPRETCWEERAREHQAEIRAEMGLQETHSIHACHISIPRDRRFFLIELAGWLFVLPVCPRWHPKVRSSFRGLSGDTGTLVGIELQPRLLLSASADGDVLAVSVHLGLLGLEARFQTQTLSPESITHSVFHKCLHVCINLDESLNA